MTYRTLTDARFAAGVAAVRGANLNQQLANQVALGLSYTFNPPCEYSRNDEVAASTVVRVIAADVMIPERLIGPSGTLIEAHPFVLFRGFPDGTFNPNDSVAGTVRLSAAVNGITLQSYESRTQGGLAVGRYTLLDRPFAFVIEPAPSPDESVFLTFDITGTVGPATHFEYRTQWSDYDPDLAPAASVGSPNRRDDVVIRRNRVSALLSPFVQDG